MPTLYVFIFGYSFFFVLGILYYFSECYLKNSVNLDNLTNFNVNTTASNVLSKLISLNFYVIYLIILIILSFSLYTKPLSYYLLISLATIIIMVQIFYNNTSLKTQGYVILFLQIIPLAFIIRSSSFIINPYLIGPDVPWHFHQIQQIIEQGSLEESAYHYYYYPSYHITQAIGGVLLGYSKDIFYLINIIQATVSILFAYLIGKEIFDNEKAGLICALLLSVSSANIFLAILNTSKIGGATLFALCFWLLLKINKSPTLKNAVLLWISAVPLFFWHPEVSFVLMVILGANFVTQIFEVKIEHRSLFILYLVGYVAYLLYVHTSLFTSIVDSIFVEKQSTPGLISSYESRTINMEFLFQSFLAYLGITIPLFFVSYRGFKWINNLTKISLFILSSFMLLHFIPVIGVLGGNFGLNPERTLIYVSMIAIFMSSGTLVEVFVLNNKASKILLIILFFTFSFFSVSAYFTGDGNTFLKDEISIGTIFTTKSNLASHQFLERTPEDSSLISDYETLRYTGDPVRGFFGLPNPIRDISEFSAKMGDGYIVLNNPNLRRLCWEKSLWGVKVNQKIRTENNIYNNGDISIFSIT
ncbi:MAG: hypothetical protein PHW84_00895 [Methanosarcina sp.]|nr:hypothetical protein [Methanosarcina sp.]